ncbi:hypothetical protein CPB86DRAFT_826509 [Serendipita vermifera]|nr:hypothetical protein CPB86DRAFT_826509 [Serendipita vermifera]
MERYNLSHGAHFKSLIFSPPLTHIDDYTQTITTPGRSLMSSLGGTTTLRAVIPVLTPSEVSLTLVVGAWTPQSRCNPGLVSQVLEHQIPSANLTTSNFISNNNALSPLIETLATTPPSMHGRADFRFVQEQEMGALMDQYRTTFLYHLFLTPSSTDVDIPTIVAAFWLALEPAERGEWEELARDIFSAHLQLIGLFGNGVMFNGSLWEERKRYHLRSIYLKWVGYQILHRLDTNEESILHAPLGTVEMVRVVFWQSDHNLTAYLLTEISKKKKGKEKTNKVPEPKEGKKNLHG